MEWNRILGTSIPLLVAFFSTLCSAMPIIFHKIHGGKTYTDGSQSAFEQCEFPIVSSVNSNNDSPHFAETLVQLFENMKELKIELNVDPRGSATIV